MFVMRQLTKIEREILALTFYSADKPVKEIAKELRCREHMVQRALRRMLSEGLIQVRQYCNPAALGYQEYAAWISLTTTGRANREKLRKALCDSPRTSFVTDVEGPYQLFCIYLARGSADGQAFFDDISKRAAGVTFTKTVCAILQETLFTPKRLSDKALGQSCFSYSMETPEVYLDTVDHQILAACMKTAHLSDTEIARKVGLPVSTVSYRIKNLYKANVLMTRGYTTQALDDGALLYGFMIQTAESSPELRTKFHTFCAHHPKVTAVLSTLGAWDYQVEIELTDARDIFEVVQEFYETFPRFIRSIQTVPEGTIHKLTPYPFELERQGQSPRRKES